MSKLTYEVEMADLAVSNYLLLKQALSLAITAPDDKDSDKAVKVALELSNLFSEATWEKAKAEVDAELNLNPEVRDEKL